MDEKVTEAKKTRQHSSLFLVACARGLLPDCQKLLEAGALPDTKDKGGLGAAHFAAAHGKAELLAYLWSKGIELDSEDPKGRTPLHLAALGGHVTALRLLLQKGCWPDAFDEADNSALHLAARSGQVEAVEELLGAAAKTEVRNKRGVTPLGEAIVSGHLIAAKALHAAGANRGDRPRGLSLLHLAAGAGQPTVMEWLLTSGASHSDSSNVERVTPLHCAAMSGSLEAVRILITCGTIAAATSKSGRVAANCVPPACTSAAAITAVLSRAGGAPAASDVSTAFPASRPGAPQHDSPQTPAEGFLSMSAEDQLRRARRWSEDEGAPLAKEALDALPTEVQSRVKAAASLARTLAIHKASTAVHNDEDFQQDLLRLPLEKIIEDVQEHPSNYAKYVANPAVDRALATVRAFHSVVKANGGSKVSLQQLAAGDPIACQERDRWISRHIEAKHNAHLKAACAAAAIPHSKCNEASESAAKTAFDEALEASTTAEGQLSAAAAAQPPSNLHHRRSAAAAIPRTPSIPEAAPPGPRQHATTAQAAATPSRHNIAIREPAVDSAPPPEDVSFGFNRETIVAECKRTVLQLIVMVISAATIAWFLRLGPFASLPGLPNPPLKSQSETDNIVERANQR